MRSGRELLVVVGGLSLALVAGPGAMAHETPRSSLHVTTSGANSELVKKVPIANRAGRKQRVAMSLGPDKLGSLGAGDTVRGSAEIEVSVTCLERMPKCVGRIYRFSPKVRGRLVLAGAGGARSGLPVSGWNQLRCSQRLPNRNHHCVLVVEGSRELGAGECSQPCHLNLVIGAHHRRARRGQKLVVGVDDDDGIVQDKGRINAAVHHLGRVHVPAMHLRQGTRSVDSVPVGRRRGTSQRSVIYSLRLDDLRAGEALVVDAQARLRLRSLPYNALIQSQLIVAEGPASTERSGIPYRVVNENGRVGESNGFNCTRGPSAHSTPCLVRKVGVIDVLTDARESPKYGKGPRVPLYLNLVVAGKAVYGGRHRTRDRLGVGKGLVHAERYGPN